MNPVQVEFNRFFMDKENKKERNQNGEIPSDVPSKKLIHPPTKSGIVKEHKSNFNTTGKDYKLGDRKTVR
jgi:hypothetical protein